MKQTSINPDFIKDNKRPEGFSSSTPAHINKASFNGDTYSWSSDNGGWFKDTPSSHSPLELREDEIVKELVWRVAIGNICPKQNHK